MKKIIIALLVVAMLVSAAFVCWSMNTKAETIPGIGTTGATITNTWTGEHKDDAYFTQLGTSKGVTFTKITTYDELCAITNGADANNLKYYYLSLPEGTEKLSLNGKNHIKTRQNIYIDFNGYTVDISGDNNGVFMALHNSTVKNLKITGTVRYVSDRAYYSARKTAIGQSALTTLGYSAPNSANGVVHLDNIVCETAWKIHQQHGYGKYMGGLISDAANGSTISNCVYNGTIIAENDTVGMAADPSNVLTCLVGRIGGIIGSATGVTFDNCVSKGSLTISDGIRFVANGGDDTGNGGARVGGIAGYVGGASKFTNCQNEMAITINAIGMKGTADSTVYAGQIGGVAGYAEGTTSFDRCTNKGDISNTKNTFHIGGVVGYTAASYVKDCLNAKEAQITSYATSSQGDMRGIGGVIGYGFNMGNITNCQNDGTVQQSVGTTGAEAISAPKVYIGGIVGRFYSDNEAKRTIANCLNNGAVSGNNTATQRETGAAGILGTLQSGDVNAKSDVLVISNCINKGNISGRICGGMIGTSYPASATANPGITISDSKNYGSISASYTVTDNFTTGGTVVMSVAGGMIAQQYGSGNTIVNINNSSNYGAISANGVADGSIKGNVTANYYTYAGGIVGEMNFAANFTGVVNEVGATVTTSKTNSVELIKNETTDKPTANLISASGGIIGEAGKTTTISGVTNKGNILNGRYAGGVLGWASVDVTFADCTNLANVKGRASAGGIVGYVTGSASFKNCTNGSMATKDQIYVTTTNGDDLDGIGGIVGYTTVDAKVEGCQNYAHVYTATAVGQASKYVGGIVGRAAKQAFIGYDITDTTKLGSEVVNYGKITLNNVFNQDHTEYVGGIIGEAVTAIKVANCKNYGAIEATKSYTKFSTTGGLGGIIGVPYDATDVTADIDNCINYGDIFYSGTTESSYAAGGIIGRVFSKTGAKILIDGCYNYGAIYSTTDFQLEFAGGLIGRSEGGTITMNNCHNNGNVTGVVHSGGLIGYTGGKPTISNSTSGMDPNYPVTITATGDIPSQNSTGYVGGIMAQGIGSPAVTNCKVGGNIIVTNWRNQGASNDAYIGGFTGHSGGGGTYTGCINNANITVSGSGLLGGVSGGVGRNNVASLTFNNCINNGNITVNSDSVFLLSGAAWSEGVGGLFANGGVGTVTLNNCQNNGDIKVYTDTSVGGLAGYVADGHVIMTDCINTGEIIADAKLANARGVGGLLGKTTKNVTFTRCTNDGPVTADGNYHTGGIAGHVLGLKTFTDCENTEKGIITFTEDTALNHMIGVGGILGYGQTNGGSEAASKAVITYCVNNGAIVMPSNATGSNVHIGGIVGRFANPTYFTIDYCQNNGDISAATKSISYVGGILGIHQNWQATSLKDTYVISNTTNTGALKGYRTGGLVGKIEAGGNGTTEWFATITLNNCVNSGTISSVSYGGGIAGFHSDNASNGGKPFHIVYDITNCANTGDFIAGSEHAGIVPIAANAEVNATNFISAGKFTVKSSNRSYVTIPKNTTNQFEDSIEGVYVEGIGAATNDYEITVKSEEETNALLRKDASAFLVFDRADLMVLYSIALSTEDKSAFEAELANVKLIAEREVEGSLYFKATQKQADEAYKALYDKLYPESFASTFEVVLPVSVSLEDGLDVTVSLNSYPKATLALIVTQNGIDDGGNFKLYMNADNSNVIEFVLVDSEGNEYGSNRVLFDIGWGDPTGVFHYDTVTKVDSTLPGRYSGKLTFTVDFDPGT